MEEAARQLYREWFVCLRFPGHEHTRITKGVPDGWERIYLGDAVKTQYGYTESATDEPVGPKFLRATDINKAPYIDWSTVPHCPIDEILQRKYQLGVDDIVIIRMVEPGKVAIAERDIDAVFASYLIRVLPTNPRLTPYYLFYCLSGDEYQGFISGVARLHAQDGERPPACGLPSKTTADLSPAILRGSSSAAATTDNHFAHSKREASRCPRPSAAATNERGDYGMNIPEGRA